jgi:hypothetical protein
LRQEPIEILALVLPCGQGNFPEFGRFERVLNEPSRTAACSVSFGFALQRNDSSDNYTSFREHFSHNGNSWNRKADRPLETQFPWADYFGSKRIRRICLWLREQADHETLSPNCGFGWAFVFVSHGCLFTLSEDPGLPGCTTEIIRK